jgi:three-Cys-motif partner protein
VTVLGSAASSLVYIDGFAGRGKYTTGEPGSPLTAIDAALRSMDARKNRVREFVCYFIEENRNNYAELEEAVEEKRPTMDPRIKVHLHRAKFSDVAGELISTITAGKQPAFVFVDPFGYDDPPMDVLGQFLEIPRVEVFINLMFNFINFGIGIQKNEKLAALFDRLFGTTEWRELTTRRGEVREQGLVQLYRRQLKNRGAQLVTPFRMSDDDIDRTLYYLLHATQHLHGATIMKNCMVSVSSAGELGYAGVYRHQMRTLFNLGTLELPAFLMDRFLGKTRTFDQVLAESIDEAGPCTEKDYRACLKQMEKDMSITVQRVTSKSQKGLSKDDLITFHGRLRLF